MAHGKIKYQKSKMTNGEVKNLAFYFMFLLSTFLSLL